MTMEEDVRLIVREELALVLKSLSMAAAQEHVPYETGEIKAQVLATVAAVADRALTHLHHAHDCNIRHDSQYGYCTCNEGDDAYEDTP